jgi:tRNA (guanine-N7-)-methyltransferase
MPREIFDAIHAERLALIRKSIASILPARDGRLVLEIGCGNGHFLTAFAAAHPHLLCVGLDLRLERVEKAIRKRDRAQVTNLHFVRCEARDFIRELPAGTRLLDIFLLFPDPWPKKRHHKNRIVQPEFLNELAARSGQGSTLFFRTDYGPYFEAALETMVAHSCWKAAEITAFPFEHQTIFQSRAPSYRSLAAEWVSQPSTSGK